MYLIKPDISDPDHSEIPDIMYNCHTVVSNYTVLRRILVINSHNFFQQPTVIINWLEYTDVFFGSISLGEF